MRRRFPRAPRLTRRGFTIVEVMVALIVLGAGLLGLAAGTSMAARMAGRGARAGAAAMFAAQRMESLRPGACTSRADGADTLFRNGQPAVINTWRFTDAGNNTHNLRVVTTYTATAGLTRSFTSEEGFSCLP